MGHAVLGYLGLMDNDCEKNTVASISRHRDFLCDCLNESGEMLIKEYGFPREEVEAHLKSLLVRYEGMKDDLYRLTRDPVRKLGNNERIIGVIRKCLKHGIKCESLCKLVKITIDYGVLSNDKEIEDIFKISSYGGILERICGINKDSDEYSYILEHMLER